MFVRMLDPHLRPWATALAGLMVFSAHASTQGVVISQVYGGGGASTGSPSYTQDYVELFNASQATVSLAGWSLQYGSATGNYSNVTSLPGVSLAPGQYFLVAMGAGSAGGTLPAVDATGTLNLSATNGKVALVATTSALSCGGATACTPAQTANLIDRLSFGSAGNGEGGSAVGVLSTTTAALRAANGCTDSDNNGADFSVATPAPRSSASAFNVCGGGVPLAQPIVPLCPTASLASGTAGVANVSASDADSLVNGAAVVGTWPSGFSLGSFSAASGDGASAAQQVLVSAAVAAGSYSLPLLWSNNEAQSAQCTLVVNVSGLVRLYSIQGSGSSSPMLGQTVTTQGVVTKLTNAGYFIQDLSGDGNPATSDGVLVYQGTAPSVSVGQLLQLSATVAEFNTGSTAAGSTVTELTTPTGVTVLGSGYVIEPTEISLPKSDAELEALEGMLLRVNGPLTVSQNYFLGRYGQLTLSAGGRLEVPTNQLRPGVDALALQLQNQQRSLLLDDGSSLQNPNPTPYFAADNTVRAGDSVASVTGVLDYGLATSSSPGAGDYKIHPTLAPVITRSNARSSAPDTVAGNVKVGSFNVLNYFTSLDDGSCADCRGANTAAEFTRQRNKIIAAIVALNADVVGLMEIQNNGNTAVQNLVDGLNAVAGAGTYATIPVPAAGTGTDAIRMAMVYKPARVSLVGLPLSDTAAINSRPTLAQSFRANGKTFSVVVNHFKSKGSCPSSSSDVDADQGDLQGCWNNKRVLQAQQLLGFIGTVQAAALSDDVLVIGDLNAYAQEDPIDTLTSSGLVDQVARFSSFGYSYVFDGAAGRLDHAISTPGLSAKVAGVSHWHINADEPSVIDYNTEFKQPACATCGPDYYVANPYRASDHDPVLVGLALYNPLLGTSGRDTIVGTAGDDQIEGGAGADVLTGGAGRDVFVYRNLRDAGDTVTDFTPGTDRVDLAALLASIGRSASTASADGVLRWVASGANTLVLVDSDGSAGPLAARTLMTLQGVSPASLQAGRDFGL
jgi:uncharacterized protein